MKSVVSHCCVVRCTKINNGITVLLLQQTATLPIGRCHTTLSRCGLSSTFFYHLLFKIGPDSITYSLPRYPLVYWYAHVIIVTATLTVLLNESSLKTHGKLEMCSRIDMQTHARRIPAHPYRKGLNRNRKVRVWILPLTFWLQGQCMPRSRHGLNYVYRLRCW